jgi:hypothetical protein
MFFYDRVNTYYENLDVLKKNMKKNIKTKLFLLSHPRGHTTSYLYALLGKQMSVLIIESIYAII